MQTIDFHILDGVRGGVDGGVLRGLAGSFGGKTIETIRKAINAGVVAASTWGIHVPVKTIPEPPKVEQPEPERPTPAAGSGSSTK
jgi:hypothetical protein